MGIVLEFAGWGFLAGLGAAAFALPLVAVVFLIIWLADRFV